MMLLGTAAHTRSSSFSPFFGEGDHVCGEKSKPPLTKPDTAKEALTAELVNGPARNPEEGGSLVRRPETLRTEGWHSRCCSSRARFHVPGTA